MRKIYVIGTVNGPYKVGVSSDPEKRLRALQTGSAAKLLIHHQIEVGEERAVRIEGGAHALLRTYALTGEWFSASLADTIQAVERSVSCDGFLAAESDDVQSPIGSFVFPGVVCKEPGSDYGIYFPNLPGCVTAANALPDLPKLAEEALQLHLEALMQSGTPIIPPTEPTSALREAHACGGFVLLVPVDFGSGRAVRVNITLDERVLRRIDAYAEEHGYTRSGFLARAASRAMADAA